MSSIDFTQEQKRTFSKNFHTGKWTFCSITGTNNKKVNVSYYLNQLNCEASISIMGMSNGRKKHFRLIDFMERSDGTSTDTDILRYKPVTLRLSTTTLPNDVWKIYLYDSYIHSHTRMIWSYREPMKHIRTDFKSILRSSMSVEHWYVPFRCVISIVSFFYLFRIYKQLQELIDMVGTQRTETGNVVTLYIGEWKHPRQPVEKSIYVCLHSR